MTRIVTSSFVLAVTAFLAACSGNPSPELATFRVARGGEIWAATCNRCHNLRPPRQFTPEEWPVIVNHMRARADLTREQAEAVAAYLKQLSAQGSP